MVFQAARRRPVLLYCRGSAHIDRVPGEWPGDARQTRVLEGYRLVADRGCYKGAGACDCCLEHKDDANAHRVSGSVCVHCAWHCAKYTS
eukprot:scaffold52968_cov74-Phaeocystis_antarctica.AAC.3